MRKDLIITALLTFCLASMLFMAVPTRSQATLVYDPWKDLNDDGILDILDLVQISGQFHAQRTPINKTKLLLEVNATYSALLSRIAYLNASLLDLESYYGNLNATLNQRINSLIAQIVSMNATMVDMQAELTLLNATKLGKPDYVSNWTTISPGQSVVFTHNQQTTHVLVYMIGKASNTSVPYIHQICYGGDSNFGSGPWGVYWSELTETTVRVTRQAADVNWKQVRVMVWKIPEP